MLDDETKMILMLYRLADLDHFSKVPFENRQKFVAWIETAIATFRAYFPGAINTENIIKEFLEEIMSKKMEIYDISPASILVEFSFGSNISDFLVLYKTYAGIEYEVENIGRHNMYILTEK